MEFKGQYLTYQEYQLLGGTLEEMPFNLLEFDARKRIDKRTFERLVDKGQEYQDVKLCVFKLIPILQSYDKYNMRDKSISSVNTDGYSESYDTPKEETTKAKESEVDDLIETELNDVYVNGVWVLYRGADC